MKTTIGKTRFVFLLGFLSAFPPMATDMYLPSLPMLQKIWGESMESVNFTLAAFFISFCISLLIYGPVSDQFGRKKPLLIGIGIYIVGSFLCSTSENVSQLIIYRVIQAAGAASASGLSIAICKDIFKGNERKRIIALVNVIMSIAPMIAPTMGSVFLLIGSWKLIFIVQAVLGIAAWIGVFMMPETLCREERKKASDTARAYYELLKNKRYILLTIMFSVIVIPHFAFIAISSNIFINRFGFSEQIFGLFFALNAAAVVAGSFACSLLSFRISSNKLITVSLVGITAGGALIALKLLPGPWGFIIPMAVFSFAFGLSRPPAMNMILDQVSRFAGAASSFLIFFYFMTASVAMRIITLEWGDRITALGMSAVITGGGVLAVWLILVRKNVYDKV